MGYDCRFCQRAAANPSWSTIDTTLWNLVFARKARVARCNHCFSLSHASNQCKWAPDIIPHDSYYQQPPNLKYQPICKAWNMDTKPGCSYANCAHKHICWYCSNDPRVLDKAHKGVFCPYQPRAGRKTALPLLPS